MPIKIHSRSPGEASEREVLDLRQCAAYLGLTGDTVYKYAAAGTLPAFKLGNRWRFKRSLLDRWMEQQSSAGKAQAGSREQGTGNREQGTEKQNWAAQPEAEAEEDRNA
jgi:excisionase family DNA binding protein